MIFLNSNVKYALNNITGDFNELTGNIGDTVTITIDFRVQTFLVPTSQFPLMFAPATQLTTDFIQDLYSNRFLEFKVGDEIVVASPSPHLNDGTYIIIEKLNDSLIRVSETDSSPVTFTSHLKDDGTVLNKTEPKGISYDFGIVENGVNGSFNSLVDGSNMRFRLDNASAIPSSATAMNYQGSLSSKIGSATIEKTGEDLTNYIFNYQIVHTTTITPFYLDTQLNVLLNGQQPSYFLNGNALKHIFRLRGYNAPSSVNYYTEFIKNDLVGNTGFIEEHFNGGAKNYSANSLAYDNSLNALLTNAETEITFNVFGAVERAKYVRLWFILLPEISADYQNIASEMYKNYVYDYVDLTLSASAINGNNFGTGYQVLKACEADVVDSNTISVTATIDLGADALAKVNASTNKYYWIVANVLGEDKTTADSDGVALQIDLNTFKTAYSEDVIETTTRFLAHDINDAETEEEGIAIIKVEDEVVADTVLTLDTTDNLNLTGVTFQIICKKVVDDAEVESVILQNYTLDLTQFPLVAGIRQFNFIDNNQFNVLDTEIRKKVRAYRYAAADDTDIVGYRFQYPFLFRWESWEQLNIPVLPADFFDTTQPFNGYNHDWVRLGRFTNWGIYYRLIVNYSDGTNQFSQNLDTEIDFRGYEENTEDWDNLSIKIYDAANNELISGGVPYFELPQRCKVVCECEYIGAGTPSVDDYFMVARIIPKQIGGHINNNSTSQIYNREPISYLSQLTLSEASNVFTGVFYIEPTEFVQNGFDYTISVSINTPNRSEPIEKGKAFQHGALFAFQTGKIYIFQDQ